MEQQHSLSQGRDLGLDAVRALAIVMVLIIHSASASLSLPMDRVSWWCGLAWACLVRPAVPLFFLCSGALMLTRDIPLKRLFGHNLLRILIALFVWAFGYQLILRYQLGDLFSPGGLWAAVKGTLLFQHEFHFYYLHILILVYCFLPVVRTFLRGASRREEEYFLLFWAVTGLLFPVLGQFRPFSLIYPINLWYTMNQAYSAVGYCVLGHYLRTYGHTISRRWYLLSLTTGFLICLVPTVAFSLRDGALFGLFQEGMSPGPALMALGTMGLILSVRRWSGPLAQIAVSLSKASFCIYLVHIAVQKVLFHLGYSNTVLSALTIPGMALILLAVSYLIYELLCRLPWVYKWLV